jgi:hypothetical protein
MTAATIAVAITVATAAAVAAVNRFFYGPDTVVSGLFVVSV